MARSFPTTPIDLSTRKPQKLSFEANLLNRFVTPCRALISGPSMSGKHNIKSYNLQTLLKY